MSTKRVLTTTLVFACSLAQARTKLVSLPGRDTVILEMSHPHNTLVEEERVLPLQKGRNEIDFSWKGVAIDSDSIRIRMLSHPDQVVLLSVTYPPDENALVWTLHSEGSWEERVRISYILYSIDRLVTYKAVADKEETQVDLSSFLVVRNFSGETFDQARIELDQGEGLVSRVEHEETQKTLLFEKEGVPVKKTFTFDARTLPWDPTEVDGNVGIPVHYVIENAESSSLGVHALSDGKARIFQDDGHGSTIFLGEDNASFVPVGEEMKLYIGDSRDVVVTQRKMKEERINLRKNSSGGIVLYDTDELIQVKVENFKDEAVDLTLIETIEGEWEMAETTAEYKKKDANTLEFTVKVPASDKKELSFQYHRRNVR